MSAASEREALLAALQADGEAVLVPVHARPGARREGLAGVHDGALKVATTSPPVDGAATAAVGKLLARALGVPPSAVRCVAGATLRRKRYRIEGLGLERCRDRLRELLA